MVDGDLELVAIYRNGVFQGDFYLRVYSEDLVRILVTQIGYFKFKLVKGEILFHFSNKDVTHDVQQMVQSMDKLSLGAPVLDPSVRSNAER